MRIIIAFDRFYDLLLSNRHCVCVFAAACTAALLRLRAFGSIEEASESVQILLKQATLARTDDTVRFRVRFLP